MGLHKITFAEVGDMYVNIIQAHALSYIQYTQVYFSTLSNIYTMQFYFFVCRKIYRVKTK